MIVRVVRFCAILCFLLIQSKAEVTVENFSYRNLLISFSPNVIPENETFIVDSVQKLVEEASKVLHTAIGLRIGSALIRIPETWDTSSWKQITAQPTPLSMSRSRSDILLDDKSDSAFGTYPFTLQYGGCGVPGHQITVPIKFLKDNIENDYPKGKLLAREWLKYRYGVFDENGFDGDRMYPSVFTVPGSSSPGNSRITGCLDPDIFKDIRDNNCSLESLTEESCQDAKDVKSSLMYFNKVLKDMVYICGKNHSHNAAALNKHNVLCDEKSIWSVVKESQDFKTDVPNVNYEKVYFTLYKDTKPRVVLAWENSRALHSRKDLVKFGVKRFIYDLPEKSKLALYSFKNQPTELLALSEITDNSRRTALVSDFVWDDEVCVNCVLHKALDLLLNENPKMQGTIILVVGSSLTSVDPQLEEKLTQSQLCLTIIAVSRETSVAGSYRSLTSTMKCGTVHELPSTADEKFFFQGLWEAMHSSMPSTENDVKISTVTIENMSNSSSVKIPADPTAAKYTLWLANSVEESSISCAADGSHVTLEQEINEANIVSFSFTPNGMDVICALTSPLLSSLTQVQMASRPAAFFDGSVWIYDTTRSDKQMPVIVYVKILFQRYPVQNAHTKVTVKSPTGKTTEVNLFDNGCGDPDITQFDGIYSGYFTEFDKEGDYIVGVSADDNNKQAKIGMKGSERCCGQQVKTETSSQVPPFQKELKTAFRAIGARPEAGYMPSKTRDLRIASLNLPNSIVLNWTAPGGSKAKMYTIKAFQERDKAIADFKSGLTLRQISVDFRNAGETETVEILLGPLPKDVPHYLAMQATSEGGLPSDISNVLEILPELILTTDSDTITRDIVEVSGSTSQQTIWIVVGSIILVLIIVSCVYLGVCLISRRRRREDKGRQQEGSTGNGVQRNVPVPLGSFRMNSIPADVILKHHNDVVIAKRQKREPPIFTEEDLDSVNTTPVLSENVHRNRNAEYSSVQKQRKDEGYLESDSPKSHKRITAV